MIDIVPLKKIPNSPLLRVLKGEALRRPPCWLMRQAGRYLPEYLNIRKKFDSFESFLFSTSDIVEVTLQPLNRFNLDAAIIFSDILVIPMMLGQEVKFLEKRGPQLSIFSSPNEITEISNKSSLSLCQPLYEAIHQVRSKLPLDKALIGFAGGPWTVASYMLEGQTSKSFSKIKTFAYRWPQAFELLLQNIADLTARHLIEQIKAGADVIKIFDSWAGSVPENKIYDWIIVPHQQILTQIRAEFPDTPVISFPKGLERALKGYLRQVNISSLALGQNVDLIWAAKELQPHVAIQGALDPQILVVGGDTLKKEVERQLQILGQGPYIFNLGHGVVPETPPENVATLLQLIDRICG